MSYSITYTGAFKKDYKRIVKRGYSVELLQAVINMLAADGDLPEKYYPHPLKGNYTGFLECHIKPDWLLIWKTDSVNKVIELARTGTHSDLFK
jgi:mRNA interferase YafQ